MILTEFKLAFTSPKFTLCEREIKIYKVEPRYDFFLGERQIFLYGDGTEYEMRGNMIYNNKTFSFYTDIFAGKDARNIALKYLKNCLKNEANHSELHYKRYLKFLEDFDLK